MNPKLLPSSLDGQIDRIVEESGEVVTVIGSALQAIGKTGRFGLTNHHPNGGQNNAAMILSELADLRHAISVVENSGITDHAKIVHIGPDGRTSEFVWTDELISANDLRDLVGDEEHDSDIDFLADNKVVPVCAGEWHREGMDYRLYVDPEFEHA